MLPDSNNIQAKFKQKKEQLHKHNNERYKIKLEGPPERERQPRSKEALKEGHLSLKLD